MQRGKMLNKVGILNSINTKHKVEARCYMGDLIAALEPLILRLAKMDITSNEQMEISILIRYQSSTNGYIAIIASINTEGWCRKLGIPNSYTYIRIETF